MRSRVVEKYTFGGRNLASALLFRATYRIMDLCTDACQCCAIKLINQQVKRSRHCLISILLSNYQTSVRMLFLPEKLRQSIYQSCTCCSCSQYIPITTARSFYPTYTYRQVFQSRSDIALFSRAEIIRIRAYHPRGVSSDSHKSRVRHNRFQS